jgi:DNA-binding transcriptional ArsR family regulator
VKVDLAFSDIIAAGKASYADFAGIVLASHQQMTKHLPAELFADPARAMLLELFIAEERRVATSVGVACIASGVPQSTALRWVESLRDRGLIHTATDRNDRRRTLVRLTETAHSAMTAYLRSVSPVPLGT